MDQNCKMPSVSMGEIRNPCAVQVTSKLTFVGNGALSQPTKAKDLFPFSSPPPALQIIAYIMYGLIVAVWFTCEMLSGSCVWAGSSG